jgi:hypothetical protein
VIRFLALALVLFLVGCRSETVPDVYGVRLGMTASDVRDRFTGAGGNFKADVAADDYSIRWTVGADTTVRAKNGEPNPLDVELAFHMGSLVAIIAHVPSDAAIAKGPTYALTKGSVMKRESSGAATTITVLARDCPTHKAQAEKLVDESRK